MFRSDGGRSFSFSGLVSERRDFCFWVLCTSEDVVDFNTLVAVGLRLSLTADSASLLNGSLTALRLFDYVSLVFSADF
jgi:hypothetical protein